MHSTRQILGKTSYVFAQNQEYKQELKRSAVKKMSPNDDAAKFMKIDLANKISLSIERENEHLKKEQATLAINIPPYEEQKKLEFEGRVYKMQHRLATEFAQASGKQLEINNNYKKNLETLINDSLAAVNDWVKDRAKGKESLEAKEADDLHQRMEKAILANVERFNSFQLTTENKNPVLKSLEQEMKTNEEETFQLLAKRDDLIFKVACLMEHVSDLIALQKRCLQGDMTALKLITEFLQDEIELIIAEKGDINQVDKQGFNLVHYVCLFGDLAMLKKIMSLGANNIEISRLLGHKIHDDDHLEAIAKVTGKALKKVTLSHDKCNKKTLITDRGVQALSSYCRELSWLDISGCRITNKSLRIIIKNCPQLKYLNLSISNENFLAETNWNGRIVGDLVFPNLEHLNLNGYFKTIRIKTSKLKKFSMGYMYGNDLMFLTGKHHECLLGLLNGTKSISIASKGIIFRNILPAENKGQEEIIFTDVFKNDFYKILLKLATNADDLLEYLVNAREVKDCNKNEFLKYIVRLTEYSANIDITSNKNCPLLIYLIEEKREAAALALIEAGANIHVKKGAGSTGGIFPRKKYLTAVELAYKNNQDKVLEHLVERGASGLSKDKLRPTSV